MARPTTWRRSFNITDGIADQTSTVDLLTVQSGETLGGVWWTYKAHAGPFSSTTYVPGRSTSVVAMRLKPNSAPLEDPLFPLFTDWLWWEQMVWGTTMAASTDINQLYETWGPREHRKVEAMRKAPDTENAVLQVAMQTDRQGAPAAFVNAIRLQVTVAALIILP